MLLRAHHFLCAVRQRNKETTEVTVDTSNLYEVWNERNATRPDAKRAWSQDKAPRECAVCKLVSGTVDRCQPLQKYTSSQNKM